MQDIFGSVRRSLVFRSPTGDDDGDDGAASASAAGSMVEKINSCIRKSRVFSSKPSPPRLPAARDNAASPTPPTPEPTIRWRKGELIGCGAFGQVYMGMNLDSGELLAVKQFLIPANHASKEKAQIHVEEIEDEVKLLQNLYHQNIVRYLGTVREEESLNILLEFVPGGSISSLLGKFGSFPESVIRMYTKQLLLGLDYLHKNGIMHRDIKGANILVDNKGCIKLADFGASKQVVELATVSGAKSMKGTPYWMAPEVIRQTGHSFSADIWSVGCTVIEMATGKPPWSQQYQEVAALFYIGTTKAHPPIPEQLSAEAKDFLLKCLQKEPELRPTAGELLQHSFVTGKLLQSPSVVHRVDMDLQAPSSLYGDNLKNGEDSMDMCNLGTLDFSTMNPQKLSESRNMWKASNGEHDMCQIDDKDDIVVDGEPNFRASLIQEDFSKSFNPISEPSYDWRCQNDQIPDLVEPKMNLDNGQVGERLLGSSASLGNHNNEFSFSCAPSVSEDDDEVTDSKIRAFLDEKALELKKLQTPLYEEYYNSLNPSCSQILSEAVDEDATKYLKLPPKSRSPSRGPTATPSTSDAVSHGSPGSGGRRVSSAGSGSNQDYAENLSPQRNDWKGLLADAQQEPSSPSVNFSEIQRKWKEELDQELERKREMIRQATGGKTSSPKDRTFSRSRSRFASPGK